MPLDLTNIRSFFPHTQNQIYLNHAAISPLSQPVIQATQAYLSQRHGDEIENYTAVMHDLAQLRTELAKLLNVTAADIALTQNTSSGLNLLAQGLHWQSGDRILLNSLEFPANVYPFLNLESQGVAIDWAHPHEHYLSIDTLAEQLTPKTRLLSISYVQFLTGQRHDLMTLSELCRTNQTLLCVDAIQGLGASTLDLQAIPIDFVACGGHKWLMGLQGQGFVYLSPHLLQQINPPQAGWLSVTNPWNLLDYQLDYLPDAARHELGTPNGIGITGLLASLRFLQGFDWAEIETHILSLSDYLITELQARKLKLITPAAQAEHLGIVTCWHPEADRIHQALQDQGIACSAREGQFLRFSPHFYNTQADLTQALHALDALT